MLSGMEAARQRPARQPKQISIQNGADPLFLNGVDLNPVGNSFTPDFISAFLKQGASLARSRPRLRQIFPNSRTSDNRVTTSGVRGVFSARRAVPTERICTDLDRTELD